MSDATDMEEISYEDRLKSIAIHPATKSWIDENVFALMLGFDSLKDLNKFVKTVKTRGGSGKYAGAIDVEDCSKDNPLHLHLAVHGSKKKKYYRLGMKRRDREKPDTSYCKNARRNKRGELPYLMMRQLFVGKPTSVRRSTTKTGVILRTGNELN